jgi:CheY-like chemotaxis protein
VTISEVTASAFNTIIPVAHRQGIATSSTIDTNVPLCILSDETRIRQILMNLLSNSIKFTKEGFVSLRVYMANAKELEIPSFANGLKQTIPTQSLKGPSADRTHFEHAVIAGHHLPPDKQVIVFSIEDSGIGLCKEFLDCHMYRPFEQGHQGFSRDFGGSGLGLNIALTLTIAMGGCIITSSTPGVGSRFEVCLPITRCDRHRNSVPSTLPVAMDRPLVVPDGTDRHVRVLLAEDVPISQKIFVKMLQNCGVNEIASNGQEVLKFVHEKECSYYDMIFLDIEMPILNGMQTIKHLRETPGCEDTYVCALTAHALETTKDLLIEAGFDDWVPKPATQETLYAGFTRALEKKNTQRKDKREAAGALKRSSEAKDSGSCSIESKKSQ